MNYYQRFLGDYARDTRHLSLMAHGAYGLLLDTYYATEKPLPADLDSLCRICGAINAAERSAVQAVADLFFPAGTDGLRRNKRADIEIAKAIPRIAAAKANGLKRANQSASQQEATGLPSGATALHHSSTPTPKPSPSPSPTPKGQNPSAARRAPARVNGKAKDEGKTNPCWQGYSEAYALRYGVAPVRNAKVNGMLAKFLDRVPVAEAPEIVAFYVRSNRGLYVSAKHCVDLLLRDAESLRTEWATGHASTDTEARQADRTAATGNAFAPLIAEARARELTEKTSAK